MTMKMIPAGTSCYSCHCAHGAVDTTLVQFRPTLLPPAKARSTPSAACPRDEAKRHASSG